MPDASSDQIKRVAGLELNALRFADVLPVTFEGARVRSAGTPIYDVNGELLFHRVPIARARGRIGYADLAVNPVLGGPLLAVSQGMDWNEPAIRKAGAAAARRRRRGISFDRVRFAAYSFPKIALQFLKGEKEVLMLELETWAVVPPTRAQQHKPLEPENFERWSLIDELPKARKQKGARDYDKRLKLHEAARRGRVDVTLISKDVLGGAALEFVDTRDVHFSPVLADHHVCYELRGQRTNVWCVAASVEMLLDFYRYDYDQVRIAQELQLGTLANPTGLPYSRDGDVVTVIENLTSNALDATMVGTPSFTFFQNEIRANRPVISFIPAHSRTVTGYTRTSIFYRPGTFGFRGLLVYDPWPPNAGVITRWENFDTHTYRKGFSAAVTMV
jgi:hypothetical protein